MKPFDRIKKAAAVLTLTGLLSGCAAFGFGIGGEDADLVVYNNSTAILERITVSGESESQSVSLSEGHPLERGESYGFVVEHPGWMTVELWDTEGHQAGLCQVKLGESRIYVTLEPDGRISASTARPTKW